MLLLPLAVCGGSDATAATKHLMRTEGEGGVFRRGRDGMVAAGEAGRLYEAAATVAVEPFSQDAIPTFVCGELDGIPPDDIPETIEPSFVFGQ